MTRLHLLTTLLSALPLLACARPPAPVAAAPPHHATEAAALRVVYRLGDGQGALLAGRTDLGPHNDARIVATAPHDAAAEELEMSARPAEDGGIFLRVRYDERTADSAQIRWEPELKVMRGVPARAEVSGAGWRRALDVTVE